MKVKKLLFIFMTVLLIITMFTGCTGKPADTEDDTNQADQTDGELPAQLQSIVDRGVLKVGTKIDVPSFGYTNPDTNETEGMEIDIAKLIAKDLLGDENKIQVTGVTAATRGPLLDNGEVDFIIATFTITDDRKVSYNFTQPYYTDSIGFLVKKDLGAAAIADLDGKIIGVAQSATTRKALEELAVEKDITFKYSEFASYPELKAALTSGRIDAFSVDKSILLGYVDESTVILDESFKPQDYGIACKLDNKDLAEYLDSFIGKIKDDGSLDQIISKWKLK